ncbi:carbamoyl phosphate synthase small subunit [Boudabousia liubingyangii]|uniref:Carbamoyl phosphate synthase small chain n=2 Tax=Boudabousia liubingyangii TaxID=1921764 RepID=A0A1Q5PNH8_9ACTO|nr:carbamoyl phosphate synthase small subunit [Boudabousia liubingyangii]
MMTEEMALLVLEDGQVFQGTAYGYRGKTVGEIVFSTGMTGYQETLTDPSYHKQIVVQTAPHIGNTGVNQQDPESAQIWVAGYVVRDAARRASNWRADGELEDYLRDQQVVGISGVDTRALTRHIRERGAMRAGIFSGSALPAGAEYLTTPVVEALVAIVQASPQMEGANLTDEVSTTEMYVVEPAGDFASKEPLARVAALDLGLKNRTPYHMSHLGMQVYVFPANATFEDLKSVNPDGVFFSNGPGDPATADSQVNLLRAVLDAKIPYFGICFGNQLLGRALGYGTYKLGYGHRGVNQPVLDRTTGKVEITAHNHGFAVDAPTTGASVAPFENGRYGNVEVSHVSLNDGVVEGLRCLDLPAFSVQYHPEAAAGPHDAAYLFPRFLELMQKTAAQEANNA